MKRQDIILDFTSLLDVTLIIIFFFVIFSHFDSEANKATTEAKVKELQEAITEAEIKEENATALSEQLEKEIELVRENSERQASNIEEILNYRKSGNIKILLEMQDGTWSVRINKLAETIAEASEDDDLVETFLKSLEEAGYTEKDTIFCDFVFDGGQPGTVKAYRSVTGTFDEIRKKYKFIYFSETDLSVGKE